MRISSKNYANSTNPGFRFPLNGNSQESWQITNVFNNESMKAIAAYLGASTQTTSYAFFEQDQDEYKSPKPKRTYTMHVRVSCRTKGYPMASGNNVEPKLL